MASFAAPSYLVRQPIEATLRRLAGALRGKATVYDIGCGHKPYATFFAEHNYTGVDTDRSSVAEIYYAGGEKIPLPDSSADFIVCTQMLQHTKNPAQLIDEIWRLLKPGGTALITVPFGIKMVAEPHRVAGKTWRDDYWRFTKYGLLLLLVRFKVVSLEETTGYAGTLLQLINYGIASLHIGVIAVPFYVLANSGGWLFDRAAKSLAQHIPWARPGYDNIYCSLTANYIAVVKKP